MWIFDITLFFHWFAYTNFKNSNLFEYVSKFHDTHFVEEYMRLPIEWHIDHVFWIRSCKKFHYWRLHSYSEILLKFDKIMWRFHISLLFHWFECTNFKNSNLFEYVSKFYDTNFVEEYIRWPIEWHIDHIFWTHD